MAWNIRLTDLRNVLEKLRPTEEDARRVVADAGIEPSFISFNNKAVNNWHNILTEAEKRGNIKDVIQIAREEYPSHSELIKVSRTFDNQ